jgi:hypothetical protein
LPFNRLLCADPAVIVKLATEETADDADCADGLATTSAQDRFSLMILLRNPRFAALVVDVDTDSAGC